MIKKLKLKFVILTMTSLFVLLTIIVVGMNFINYTTTVNEADEILMLISKNKGRFPGLNGVSVEDSFPDDMEIPDIMQENRLPPHMSPELPYESRYFSVLLNLSGEVIHTETSRIVSVDSRKAIEYAQKVIKSNENNGFADDFRFLKNYENDRIRIIFLDCGRRLDSFRSFLIISICMAFIGFVVVFFVIFFFSTKIIRPIAEAHEKQKRFITDAGHEIKTPLTIINANVDILEMEIGENESLGEISEQTARLRELTNDLVCLARMEESDKELAMIEFPISEIVLDSASAFTAPMAADKKNLELKIQPLLSIKGNSRAIEHLVSILMNNALKYSEQNSTIELQLFAQGRSVVLSVQNRVAERIDREKLAHVFDRFYRMEQSRSSDTGGHGIGLSIAKAIVDSHGGKIYVQSPDEDAHMFKITASFPI